MRTRAFGDRAAIVDLDDPSERDGVVHGLREAFPDAVVRAGLASVLVERRAPDPALVGAVTAALAGIGPDRWATGAQRPMGRVVEIAVDYVGEDLEEVAGILGCRPAEVVAAHVAQRWSVAMMGFAPGFGYLVPDGPRTRDWAAIPRRETPRTRVPAGSVAVAAGMTATYPSAMPGGWHLIGRTSVSLIDPRVDRDPTLLHPGDRVRFVEAGR